MSHVSLIAANKSLPLCEYEAFRVLPHEYYRFAVDELGLDLKPFQYELDVQLSQASLEHLLSYLRENFSPGEEAELWSLWVGTGGGTRPRRYRGSLADFDLDTLEMLQELQYEPDLELEYPDGLISQVCLIVTV